MTPTSNFPCTKCGACCRRAPATGWMPAGKDGFCVQLQPDGTCGIYEERPWICRMDATYEAVKATYSWPQWMRANAEICNQFMKQDGMPETYLIALDTLRD